MVCIQLLVLLFELAKSLGVTFHLSTKVDQIIVEQKVIKGVVAGGKTFFSDSVVSNLDVYFVYNSLLKSQKKPQSILKQERSTSALIFYCAINKNFKS